MIARPKIKVLLVWPSNILNLLPWWTLLLLFEVTWHVHGTGRIDIIPARKTVLKIRWKLWYLYADWRDWAVTGNTFGAWNISDTFIKDRTQRVFEHGFDSYVSCKLFSSHLLCCFCWLPPVYLWRNTPLSRNLCMLSSSADVQNS